MPQPLCFWGAPSQVYGARGAARQPACLLLGGIRLHGQNWDPDGEQYGVY